MDTMSFFSSHPSISLSSPKTKNNQTHLNNSSDAIINSSINVNPTLTNPRKQYYYSIINSKQLMKVRVLAVNDVSGAIADPVQAQVTWEIIVGAIAGVIPFVVAGIEFSKRIAAQRRCEICKGSGLVLRDNKYYFRCPGCGGFLPWQSWRRFFSG